MTFAWSQPELLMVGSVLEQLTLNSTYQHSDVHYHLYKSLQLNTLRTGDADLLYLHYNCARRVTQICVFNSCLFSLHSTLNYAINRACLRMVLLTDVYRNL